MSQTHKKIQQTLLNILPDNKTKLEVFFPTIKRKADLFWKEESLVFEIQCSPITLREVKNRNRDYNSLGLEVCWILHSKCFNKNHLSPAEKFLRESSCYYTNIGYSGPLFYDQFDLIVSSTRLFRSEQKTINLAKIYRKQTPYLNHSSYFKKTFAKRTFFFHGDLLYLAQSKKIRKTIKEDEQKTAERLFLPKLTFIQNIKLKIKTSLYTLLRRYSR